MRGFVICGVLAVALVALALAPVATADKEPIAKSSWAAPSVSYEVIGPEGVLSIANGEGHLFRAFNRDGALVADGVVDGQLTSMPVPNFGPDGEGVVLRVHLDPDLWFSVGTDDPDDWFWE